MGRMKLKAVAVKGSSDPEDHIRDYERFEEVKERAESKLDVLEGMSKYGTPKMLLVTDELGVLPTRYWQRGRFTKDLFDGVVGMYVRKKSCLFCKVGCGKISRVNGDVVEGPEYETVFAFGSLCYVSDPKVIAKANLLCDRLGLDTISTGNVIAYLFYLCERGVLSGYNFGDGDKLLELIRMIAYREGIGNELAEGVRRLSEKYGVEGVHVKGLEPPGYDPRGLMGVALAYAVSYRGACHIKHCIYRPNMTGKLDRFSPKGQAKMLFDLENYYGFTDCLIVCRFLTLPEIGPYDENDVVDLYNAVTGEGITVRDAYERGRAVIDLARRINERLGMKEEDEKLPEFFFKVSTENGVVDRDAFEEMLKEYRRLRMRSE